MEINGIPFTMELLESEIAEKTADLEAFMRAREIIRNRVLAVKDSTSPLSPLPTWSGTDCVLGGLDLAIHAMENTLMDLRAFLVLAREAEPPAPTLTVIEGGLA